MLKIVAIFLCCVFTAFAEDSNLTGLDKVAQVFRHLRTGKGFHADITKIVHVDQLDKDIESKGEIDFFKGRMRLDLVKPEKLLLVFNGKVAYQEEEYEDGDEKKPLVTRMKAADIKKGSAILATLLGSADIKKNFRLVKQDGDKFELSPTDKKSDVKVLKIEIDDDLLSSVSYVDSLDNQVTFKFRRMREKEIPKEKFLYKVPKGVKVNDL